MAAKLTSLRVRTVAAPGRYGDGGGLYLQVRGAHHKSWLFRYARHGKAHWCGLGPAADVTLALARDKARDCRRLLLAGRDPIGAKREDEGSGMALKDVAALYIAAHESTWKNPVHRAQWSSTLETYVYPVCGDLPAAKIEIGHVMKILEPIWHTKPETAGRLRGRIETVLDYASARAGAPARTQHGGAATCRTYFRPGRRSPRSSTTRLCHSATLRSSWSSCLARRALARWRFGSPS